MVSTKTPISRRIATGQVQLGGAAGGVNVGDIERLLSVAGGGLLAAVGLRQGSVAGLGLAALGGSLVYRGVTGHCPMYSALGANTAERHSRVASVAAGHGFKLTRTITVNRSPGELYRMWR